MTVYADKSLEDMALEQVEALQLWNSRFDRMLSDISRLKEEYQSTNNPQQRGMLSSRYRLKLNELTQHARTFEVIDAMKFYQEMRKEYPAPPLSGAFKKKT